MTTGWIIRALIVSLCISVAALCIERLLARTNRSTARNQRWVWVVAMFASVAVPLVSLWAKWAPPILSAIIRPDREFRLLAETAREGGKFVIRTVPAANDFGAAILMLRYRHLQVLLTGDFGLSIQMVVGTCLILSAIGLSLFVAIHLWIRRHRMDWVDDVVDGVKVCVAPSVGPAVVGFRNPEIVVPVWVLGAPQETQQAIIRHERAHIVAGDSRTLTVCGLLLAAMPWNVVLWWQYRQLRAAIETDCDARVLADGIDVRQYGAMLLNVATRSIPVPLLSPAFCANPSLIERRIRAMTTRSCRFVHLQIAGLACIALVMLGMSVDLASPKIPKLKYAISAMRTPFSFRGMLRIVPPEKRIPQTKSLSVIKNGPQEYGSANAERTAPLLMKRHPRTIRLDLGQLSIGSESLRASVESKPVSAVALLSERLRVVR